jgi:RNA polymerase sigma-70 factor (ECF subfamily)
MPTRVRRTSATPRGLSAQERKDLGEPSCRRLSLFWPLDLGSPARPRGFGTPVCGNYQAVPTEIERLYREHRAGLVRLVERELHDHDDAEDVVQTAFLDAQRALERGTTPYNPRAWLATIALNAGRRLRRRRLNAEPLEEYAAQEAAGVPEIRAALASLPRAQREAVVYRDLFGLSYDETAEQMGKSVNAVTMLLHRGRGTLRQTLGATTGGIGLWRWTKRAGMPQVATGKGAAAIVVAAGLATTGVVTARVIAPPIGTDMAAAAPLARSVSLAELLARDRGRDHLKSARGSRVSAFRAATQSSRGDAAPASARSSTVAAARSLLPSTLPVSLPTVSVPSVTISTPITAVTVTTPPSTTVAVTTPIATVTVPIP